MAQTSACLEPMRQPDTMGVNLVFLLAASYKWVLQGGDISRAFLSGVFDDRSLYLRPPKIRVERSQCWGFTGNSKRVYGLCNVPLGCGVDVSDRCWFSWDLRKCG